VYTVWELQRLEVLRRRQLRLEAQLTDQGRSEHQQQRIRHELYTLRWVLEILDEAHADMPLSEAVMAARLQEEEGPDHGTQR
jgi:hypothetical protein